MNVTCILQLVYTVSSHCVVYAVQGTIHIVNYTLSSVQCTVYSVQCTDLSVQKECDQCQESGSVSMVPVACRQLDFYTPGKLDPIKLYCSTHWNSITLQCHILDLSRIPCIFFLIYFTLTNYTKKNGSLTPKDTLTNPHFEL